MKVVLKNDEYTIYQRRDGRYAVEAADKKAINGDDKVAILVANDLIKAALPSEPEEQAVEEAAEETMSEAKEPVAEESVAEEPAVEDPAAEEPTAEEPAAEESADEESGEGKD